MINHRNKLFQMGQVVGHEMLLTDNGIVEEAKMFKEVKRVPSSYIRDQKSAGVCYAEAGLSWCEAEKNKELLKSSTRSPGVSVSCDVSVSRGIDLFTRYGGTCPPLSLVYQLYWIEHDKGQDYLEDIEDALLEHFDKPTVHQQSPSGSPQLRELLRACPGNDGGFFQLFLRSVDRHGLVFEDQLPTKEVVLNTRILQEVLNQHWHDWGMKLVGVYQTCLTSSSTRDELIKVLKEVVENALSRAKYLLYFLLTPGVTIETVPATLESLWDLGTEMLPKAFFGTVDFKSPLCVKNFVFPTNRVLCQEFVSLENHPDYTPSSRAVPYAFIPPNPDDPRPRCCRGMPRMSVRWNTLCMVLKGILDKDHAVWTAIDTQQLDVQKTSGIGHVSVRNISGVLGFDEHTGPNDFIKLCKHDPDVIRRWGFTEGKHAVLLIGYGKVEKKTEEQTVFLMQNSWGTEIGFRGEFLLYESWMQVFGAEYWVPIKELTESVRNKGDYGSFKTVMEAAISEVPYTSIV